MARFELPSFLIERKVKSNVKNWSIKEVRRMGAMSLTDIQRMFVWEGKDYFEELIGLEKKSMDKAMFMFTETIQKNLTGQRRGNIYSLNVKGYGYVHNHQAADMDEYPAVMTGRLRNSISFADSITEKVTVPIKLVVRYRQNSKSVRWEPRTYEADWSETIGNGDHVKAFPPEKDRIVYSVGTNVPYAYDLEFSGPVTGGRPFMRRSLIEDFSKIIAEIVGEMQKGKL